MMPNENLPKHVAVVMDGNGRWAKKRFLPRVAGHKAGVEAVRRIIKASVKNHIEVLSLFAFSSENWRRPKQEVSALMDLLLGALDREINQLHENNICVRFVGNRTRFNEALLNKIQDAEKLTENNNGLIVLIAVDYGGQWDICQATKVLAQKVACGQLQADAITPELFQSCLSFPDLPNPDLLIRTSGEQRLSNFMLWQLAYAELFFTDVLWPDFDETEFKKALQHYTSRERRYGHSSEQISELSC